jgi:hypothetical protein
VVEATMSFLKSAWRFALPIGACLAAAACSSGDSTTETTGGTTTATATGCPSGQVDCGGVCTNTAIDPASCGACGKACAEGEVCSAGACALACGAGTTACGGACVDTAIDPKHCGGCDTACAAGEVCGAGACATGCAGGTAACGGSCVDTKLDPKNCGACGKACAEGEVCSAGACALTCVGGSTLCGSLCVDTLHDPARCGGCDHACAPGEVCAAGTCALACSGGTTQCGLACVDTKIDPKNCGGCEKACALGEACDAGACVLSCGGGTTPCSGACVAIATDHENCGACGKACPAGNVCVKGACALDCGGGATKCGDACVDTKTDPTSCGGCGKACAAGESCVAGACALVCGGGTTKCTNVCVDAKNDAKNCGGCGVACAAGESCVAGACALVCAGGTTKCTNVCAALASDPSNCGACGKACGAGEVCSAGACALSCAGGTTKCGNACVVTATDAANCGACGKACGVGATCVSGACQASYGDVTALSRWAPADLSSFAGGARGYLGGAFDTRYVYFAPYYNGSSYHGLVTRYDTTQPWGVGASYSTFDVSSVNAAAKGFYGAAFDGKYVYFVPHYNGGYHGVVARYDTTMPFGSAGSWQTIDLNALQAGARGYIGAIFDGKYLYLVPYYNGSSYHGLVARLDTTQVFGNGLAWSFYDVSSVSAGARGMHGGTFDGRYVYFTPYHNGAYQGLVTRYDTQASFANAVAWQFFDLSTVNAGARGYSGAAFDGRYVHFAPHYNGAHHGLAARYDTQASFGQAGGWSIVDLTAWNPSARGLISATFDGRHITFLPYGKTVGGDNGLVARYDTTLPHDQASSWSFVDLGANFGARGFIGGVFDGANLYGIPYYNSGSYSGLAVRFADKAPPSLPAGWNASFL